MRASSTTLARPALMLRPVPAQENIYQTERPFVSARKVLAQLGEPYESGVELLSFHTVSKVSRHADDLPDPTCRVLS